MTSYKAPIVAAATVLVGLVAMLSPALASAASPVWRVSISSMPTNFTPEYSLNEGGAPNYQVALTNVGSAPSSGPITVTVDLPPGITEHGTGLHTVTRTLGVSEAIDPGVTEFPSVLVDVALPEGSTATATATVSGGGAVATAQASTETTVSATIAPFDFLPGEGGLAGSLTDAEGTSPTQAGSHPFQFSFDFGLPSRQFRKLGGGAGEMLGIDGGMHDQRTILPKGMVVDPAATPVRCTEVQLEALQCPSASAVGAVDVIIPYAGNAEFATANGALFNMVPGPGEAAQFAFEPAGVGTFVHISGGVHAGDYALQSETDDAASLFCCNIFGVRAQLWGDPSAPSHDLARGACFAAYAGDPCPVPAQSKPFLTMPTSCGSSQDFAVEADSWGTPGAFHRRDASLTDRNGNQTGVSGCGALEFEPTLLARPTTNVADSPSGLTADLHIPQTDNLNELATAHLRKAVVSLPEGLTLNPSSANGLEACNPSQIGIDPGTGVPNGNPVSCPDASRIGEVEVDTPLVDHPLSGAVYVATPHDNPFDSLLAIYVTINDPQSGVLVKLAGHVVPNPQTGQLTATFDNNPQLPFTDFKLSFFGGAGGVLRTPAVCGNYSTTSSLTPWSAPESGPPATPSDTYAISQGPGGSCASSSSQQPNSPSFDAGTASVVAGSYAPFVMHLSRNDGSQQFASLTLTPPPGLLGKLAGTATCPDSALAAAANKTGAQEQANPSCPADSRVGTVTVGAGAGPAPYYATGTAYLAGPYKGAPLSIAIVTPAVAGPYDLGTVVVRSAVSLDPTTAQITATSDPIPQILQGIPLDVRSIVLNLDKPNFTLNGTSCNPLAVNGSLLSTLGQSAALSERFQLAECGQLAFKPKLALRLKGGTKRGAHPALTATLTMPPGSANIAKAVVALPHSEFLDQGHIGTVCTRVQFAATECPAASIYGYAKATSPLVDYALEGPVYMRSSSHNLPDLVAALHGPPSQPIEIDLDGRIDSIHGGIRNSFDLVPDAPVSKFVLSMQGGRKGLLQNSTDICASTNRATALFDAQNGKTNDTEPPLKNSKCRKAHRKGKHKRRHGAARQRHAGR